MACTKTLTVLGTTHTDARNYVRNGTKVQSTKSVVHRRAHRAELHTPHSFNESNTPLRGREHAEVSGYERALPLLVGALLFPVDSALAATDAAQYDIALNFGEMFLKLDAMGDGAAGVMFALVAVAEMVPLLPTQPLAIACGLLFGAERGIPVALAGVTMAGLAAFLLSRNYGPQIITAGTAAINRLGLKV
eukprot:CAMPEP_0118934984 /NCGR_PEP_ID=MMETSP1169-20130426/14643_1 /TAXON_ID=36882 /ORGANISM="Pyramimonas obovata, Strain CCMP722" /LENGTH=190 /DNA_ID=CAMNT_0006877955 /DNA_START=52 /DNA_END=621 /DNA_ORIENTATION=-